MPDPLINQQTLDQLKALAANNNRSQVYLELYGLTGSDQALTEALIMRSWVCFFSRKY